MDRDGGEKRCFKTVDVCVHLYRGKRYYRQKMDGDVTYMRVEDLWRIFPTQKSHVAKLLESKNFLRDFLYCVEVEVLAWRRVGCYHKGTALKPVWEVVDDPGEEVAAKVMANGVDFV